MSDKADYKIVGKDGEYLGDKFDVSRLSVKVIDRKSAAAMCRHFHYMGTYPSGFTINYGVFLDDKKCVGVCVFGQSIYSTEKANKILSQVGIVLKKDMIIEQMRMWIDDVCGNNSESHVMSIIMKHLKKHTPFKVVITHSGGCKNDCGIVYQAAGWLYFGKDVCNDFYKTKEGKYKNIVAEVVFGRVKQRKGMTPQEIGQQAFGDGAIVEAFRYRYIYPLDRGIRRKLMAICLPFEKTSEHFRANQKWYN